MRIEIKAKPVAWMGRNTYAVDALVTNYQPSEDGSDPDYPSIFVYTLIVDMADPDRGRRRMYSEFYAGSKSHYALPTVDADKVEAVIMDWAQAAYEAGEQARLEAIRNTPTSLQTV